ncbi:MAG: glycosyltransferase [Calditrichia bacterium]
MQFSVIICTYNRSNSLSECIARLALQEAIEPPKWEVVIVDNNSTDGTDKIIAKLASQYNLNIRYVFEGQQGLNYARNAGIKASKGEYIAFIDDDILISPNWLHTMYISLVENDADAVGGRIHLDKSLSLPSWIQRDMYGFLGHQDFGDETFQMDGVSRYPFGGNMAFNRRVVDKIGFFNPELGRRGAGQKRDELYKGSETDYFHRLTAVNCRIIYQPNAIVFHMVQPFQLKKKYFLTIHYNAGYQKAFNDKSIYHRNLIGIPLFLFPQLIRGLKKYLYQFIIKGSNRAFRQKMVFVHFLGMMHGYINRKKKSRLAFRNNISVGP